MLAIPAKVVSTNAGPLPWPRKLSTDQQTGRDRAVRCWIPVRSKRPVFRRVYSCQGKCRATLMGAHARWLSRWILPSPSCLGSWPGSGRVSAPSSKRRLWPNPLSSWTLVQFPKYSEGLARVPVPVRNFRAVASMTRRTTGDRAPIAPPGRKQRPSFRPILDEISGDDRPPYQTTGSGPAGVLATHPRGHARSARWRPPPLGVPSLELYWKPGVPMGRPAETITGTRAALPRKPLPQLQTDP